MVLLNIPIYFNILAFSPITSISKTCFQAIELDYKICQYFLHVVNLKDGNHGVGFKTFFSNTLKSSKTSSWTDFGRVLTVRFFQVFVGCPY
jgi:hypothetical protein